MHIVYANMKIEKSRIGNRIELKIVSADLKEFFRQCISIYSELGTFEWDILNPDRIINLEIKNEWRRSNI